MGTTLLLVCSFLSGACGNLFNKWKSNGIKTDTALRYLLYLSLNGLVGAVFFLFSGGFSLVIDGASLLYGAICAAGVAGTVLSNVFLLRLSSVAGVHVLISAGSILGSAVYGTLLFHEVLDPLRLVRIGIMMLAMLLIFLEKRPATKGAAPDAKRKSPRPLLALLLLIHLVSSMAFSVAMRCYLLMAETADSHSLFFLTNLLSLLGALLLFLVMAPRRRHEVRPSLDMLRPRMLGLVAGSTVLSNIGSLISAELTPLLDASILTPITSAISILSAFAVSLLLRERCSRYSIGAMALSLVTVLLP